MFLPIFAEIEGLKRKLTSKLGANQPSLQPDWQVCNFLCNEAYVPIFFLNIAMEVELSPKCFY